MRLREWQYMSNPNSNTTAAANTAGYKKRFEKLIKYHIDHASSELESITQKDISNWHFRLGEHFNTGSQEFDREIALSFDKPTDTFYLNIFVDGKQVYHNDYKTYEEVLETLIDTYMYLPAEGTTDYNELLTESLNEWQYMNPPKASQPASGSQTNYPSQENRYKKLLAQIDSDKTCSYTVNLIGDRIFAITLSNKVKGDLGFRIIFKPYVPCYLLQLTTKEGTKELNCKDFDEVLDTLLMAGLIKNTDLCESVLITEELKEIPEKLYHATYLPFLDSIKAEGLGKTENKMWSDSKAGVVYLADDPWVAESYAETAEWLDEVADPDEYLDNIIILEIDVSKLDSNKLFTDSNVLVSEEEENTTWEYHGIISWDAIKIFNSSVAEDFKAYENLWD